jgi:hypothetical protein
MKMGERLASSPKTAELTLEDFRETGKRSGSQEGEFIEWLTFQLARQAAIDDVESIDLHPPHPLDSRVRFHFGRAISQITGGRGRASSLRRRMACGYDSGKGGPNAVRRAQFPLSLLILQPGGTAPETSRRILLLDEASKGTAEPAARRTN